MTRKITSAISGVTVAEVRKSLDFIRKLYKNRYENNNFYLSANVPNTNFNVGEFCLKFVVGMHTKRYLKSKQRRMVT